MFLSKDKVKSGEEKKMKGSVRAVWLVLGFCCFGLGTLGVVLPCLPTVPFYMGTGLCFAKGSEKVHQWFLGTALYKKHLERFQEKREMTRKTKVMVMGSISLLMGIGFWMMDDVPLGRAILVVVWALHLYYFVCRIKTVKAEGEVQHD